MRHAVHSFISDWVEYRDVSVTGMTCNNAFNNAFPAVPTVPFAICQPLPVTLDNHYSSASNSMSGWPKFSNILIGIGNRIVESLSAALLVSVCRYRSWSAVGSDLIISAASLSANDAFCSPSAATTCSPIDGPRLIVFKSSYSYLSPGLSARLRFGSHSPLKVGRQANVFAVIPMTKTLVGWVVGLNGIGAYISTLSTWTPKSQWYPH